MNRPLLSARLVLTAALSVGVTLTTSVAIAQQQDKTIEELEGYIKEQKVLLEKSIANREETKAKAMEVQEALAEQEARREQLEKEVDELCMALEAAEPGSYDDCKAQFSN